MPEPRLIKLPRNGPKPGQSTEAWLYGKDKNCQAERDAAKWTSPSKKQAMTDFPITPPPELVEQWRNLPEYASQLHAMSMVTITTEKLQDIATQAARWGADQQLLACGKYLEQCAAWEEEDVTEMYNYLRPKPPSLKERALQAWAAVEAGTDDQTAMAVIRRALEQLDD